MSYDQSSNCVAGDFGLTRREAVLSLSSVAALCSVPHAALAQLGFAKHFIDTHCHVFNGRDVPAYKFVLHVISREYGLGMAGPLAAFVTRLIIRHAPSYEDEMSRLRALSQGAAPTSLRLTDEQFREHIEDTLRSLTLSSLVAPSRSGARSELLDLLQEQRLLEEPSPVESSFPNLDAQSLDFIYRHYEQRSPLSMILKDQPRQGFRARLRRLFDSARRRDLAVRMVDDSNRRDRGIGVYLNFVRCFLCYRTDLVEQLDAAFGFAEPSAARLYTPALIDYEHWLAQPKVDPSTPIADQTALLAVISKRQKPGVLVNGFVAFDPLRAALDQLRDRDMAYNSVIKAIRDDGFIGVKIYPPMGFQAIDNAQPDAPGFGHIVAKLLRSCEWKKHIPHNFELGRALDDQLLRMYRYCLANDIPILAHSANSQTAYTHAGERADPKHWERLLKRTDGQPDGEFSKLRINLGHTGGLWCHKADRDAKPPATGNPDHRDDRCRFEWEWPQGIMRMVSEGPDVAPAYPHLYFDVADMEQLVTGGAMLGNLVTYLRTLQGGIDLKRVMRHLIYGTDWMFVSINQGYTQYEQHARSLARLVLGSSPDAEDNLMWRNAAQFLGLVEGEETLARLRTFYHGDADRLRTLDALKLDSFA